ncbi:GntR family transcriptional regulator [Vibrio crassostreae]|jgi:DNA-binding GntR family transcriptional regulator|nr:GntR family transcriptional regulator [Vibrio crassostreae]
MSAPTLSEKVSKMIRQDILSGEFPPGKKLVVADLKNKYKVGASPIREALVYLSWNKYVEMVPQKGCWVPQLSKRELYDLYGSLRTISPVLLRKAIVASDEGWELGLLTSYHKLSRLNSAEEEFDFLEWEERYQQFHLALLDGADSESMFEFFNSLNNQVKRYRFLAVSSESTADEIFNIGELEMIMKYALSKNIEQATKLLDQYLLNLMIQAERTLEKV